VANNSSNTISVLLNTTKSIVGNPIAGNDSVGQIPGVGVPVRLRMGIVAQGSGVATSSQTYKLQYAVKAGSCASSTYSDVTTSSTVKWYTNVNLTGGTTVATGDSNDPVDGSNGKVAQTYQDANNFTNSQAPMYAQQDGIWDFSLVLGTSVSSGTGFCFRAVTSGGSALNTYSVYPEAQYGVLSTQRLRMGKWVDQTSGQQPFALN
jgi:hypothetical protein